MSLLVVDVHAQLGRDDLWATVRNTVCDPLDSGSAAFCGPLHCSQVRELLDIGVHEDSTTYKVAFASSQDILRLLKQHGIDDVDGTLGFHFRVGEDLCGATARHMLFDVNTATPAPPRERKNVVLMWTRGFDDFTKSIQAEIGGPINTVTFLKRSIMSYAGKTRLADVCAIKLDTDRFSPNFVHNAMSLGVKIDPCEFVGMMHEEGDGNDFDYSVVIRPPTVDPRLFPLQGVFSVEKFRPSADEEPDGALVRFVVKNGCSSGTTIGRLSRSPPATRKHDLTRSFDSTEALGEFAESIDIAYVTPMHWLWNETILVKFPGASLYFDENQVCRFL
ncbi:hypothetical protein PLICRDRAFT_52060 [Plicaturopsis crispa FD-325 SS-3]|nr:hypothetical protein PLICRDRAFT_52060 [Plicaturopsis crispa FD-325 SS-3]